MNLNEILPDVERDTKDLQAQLSDLESLARDVDFGTVKELVLKCAEVKIEFEDFLGKSIKDRLQKEKQDETI